MAARVGVLPGLWQVWHWSAWQYAQLGLEKPSASFATPTVEQLAAWRRMAKNEYHIKVVSYQ